MKKILFSTILGFALMFILISCGEKEELIKIEAFNPEVGVYDLGDGWEINPTTFVKGFIQPEENGTYSAKVSFMIDLVKPDGSKIQNIANGIEEKSQGEKFTDLKIEAQFELDTTFSVGLYKMILNLKDEHSKQTVSIEKDFTLDNEE
ncbi:MAG: hypothetical protein Q8N03_11935 [Ignavibacteria bacterium]|nr:hypothetical protein [Ignavibacteria bacterium]MDP3831536.1 hypothetical protein [Ignavibacteriaceae bacterium]